MKGRRPLVRNETTVGMHKNNNKQSTASNREGKAEGKSSFLALSRFLKWQLANEQSDCKG